MYKWLKQDTEEWSDSKGQGGFTGWLGDISSSPEDERRVKGLGTEFLVDNCDIRTGVGVPVGKLCMSWLRSEDFIV